jgi:hypothetical protein
MPVFRPTGLHPPLLDYDQLTDGDHQMLAADAMVTL